MFAQATPGWYVNSGAFGLTALPSADWPEYEEYIPHQLTTSPDYDFGYMNWYPNLYAAIDNADFYGIFDYGDWPLDYEGFGVAPFNSKYDGDYGAWLQWARGGDWRWFEIAEALDRHVADIDVLHTLHEPRHWSDGLFFGHSYHDEPGFTNPHRNEGGLHPDVIFGMPGMLTTYYLTGYEKAYESALELADCLEYRLHNEWLLCDFFPEGSCSGDGIALESANGLYFDGSRPAANNLYGVVEAYRATGDSRYLAVADALVSWAQAENQPYIGVTDEPEYMVKPAMVTLYMRALGNYMEMRREFGLPDDYNGAASLATYAEWLHDYAMIEIEPVDTGARAAFPYEWWSDGRQGDPNDEYSIGNNVPLVSNWMMLGADAMAYAYRYNGDARYLEWGATLFRTGSLDPFYVGDMNTYTATKETANGVTFGHVFLHVWANR